MADMLLVLPEFVDSKDLPRWFGLSTRTLSTRIEAIVLTLSEECFNTLIPLCLKAPLVYHYQQTFGFKKFETEGHTGFGFEKVFQSPISFNGVVELVLPLSHANKTIARSASIGLLLTTMEALSEVQHAPMVGGRTQLLTLSSHVSLAYTYGAPIGGYTSPAFARWISDNAGNLRIEKEIVRTMQGAWRSLNSKKSYQTLHQYGFFAKLKPNGLFFLQCPGEACHVGSYPDRFDMSPGFGKRISCHNLDTPTRQLALLAGLAKMHELADIALFDHPHET